MRFDVVTIFPQVFDSLRASQIWKRAEDSGRIRLNVHDLRDYSTDRHRTVDDVPYGGGAGMVLKVEPLVNAVEKVVIRNLPRRKVLCTSPQGRKLTQEWVEELSQLDQIVVVAGRYEGVDERFVDGWVDESFSVGDFVLSGGELPAMMLLDAMARLIPGVVGDSRSVETDSFTSGRLKHPQYTRPANFRGYKVPDVLLSGNHQDIDEWRNERSQERTRSRRPDMLSEPQNSLG